MFIDTIPNRKSPPVVLLRESYREGGKVKKRTLANLSKLPQALLDGIAALLAGGKVAAADASAAEPGFEIVRSLAHGHVAAVRGMIRKLQPQRRKDRGRSGARRSYVIRTNVAAGDLSAERAVLNYKRLAEIEKGFRTLKGVDLSVRPIRHRLETRVKAPHPPQHAGLLRAVAHDRGVGAAHVHGRGRP